MIATAVQKTPQTVWVYNEKGSMIFSKQGYLINYTSDNLVVKPLSACSTMYVYDSKGNHLRTIPC